MSASSGTRKASISSITKRLSVISQHEEVDQEKNRDSSGQLRRPTILAALSEDEYNKLGKKATLKMDLVIMPIMTAMVRVFDPIHSRS